MLTLNLGHTDTALDLNILQYVEEDNNNISGWVSTFSFALHSLLCLSMKRDVMSVSVFPSRVRQDRKGQSDMITDCQDWRDIGSGNGMNRIDSIETGVKVVDGRQKVHL